MCGRCARNVRARSQWRACASGRKARCARQPCRRVGYLQSRLNQLSVRINDMELIQVAEEVERLTAELRDNTMGIRMMPIGSTFSKFQRLVRDLSAELKKKSP